jgi:hypothetical protein
MAAVNNSRVNLPNIRTPNLMTVVAKRNSGKSHLLKHLLQKCMKEKKFHWVIVFSATGFNGEWSTIVGEKNVFQDFDPEMVTGLLENQSKLVKKGKAKNGLLLFDDMVGTANFRSEIITKIAIASRHYKISCWLTSQYYSKLPPTVRQNSDVCLILNSVNETIARKIYEEFPSTSFRGWKEVEAYCNENTVNFGCVMINNMQQCEYSIIRAPANTPKFKILSR